MRILITGGAGFIGSHLSDHFLGQGNDVTMIDDLSTGSMDNIREAKEHPRFRYFIDTIFDKPLLAELIDDADVVFHMAAAVGVLNIVESPVHTIETNVGGSELVLELAAKKKKRVLIASTSEVYGKSTKFPFSEEDDLVLGPTTKGRWSYACSKAIDEFLALAYHRERKLPVTIVRLFNTVGPRQTGRYGMVLPTFVRQALCGAPLTVFGNGEQSRCFTHVQDIVKGLVQCISCDATVGHVFNLGNTEEVTMNVLAEKVIEATGSTSTVRYLTYDEAYGRGFEDMQRRVPDISKARQWFGYTPTQSLNDIVKSVVAYCRLNSRPADRHVSELSTLKVGRTTEALSA
ncbi:MAG TPA: GDP-mannose 4,6-dehydratase [Terriglobales bacterium]|jgi:UDP-glucose 4-epimerase|nr:GDP-mannose 4,6-dehydratase [Terriglobales bacterium]